MNKQAFYGLRLPPIRHVWAAVASLCAYPALFLYLPACLPPISIQTPVHFRLYKSRFPFGWSTLSLFFHLIYTIVSIMTDKKLNTPFYFGGLASCSAAIIVHPLDLTKVRLQNAKGSQTVGMLGTVKNIIRTEGPLKLYAGLSASILRQATYSTARLGGYEKLKQLLLQREKSKLPSCTSYYIVHIANECLKNYRSIYTPIAYVFYCCWYCWRHMWQSRRCH